MSQLGILPSRHYLSHCDDVHLELRHVGFNFTGAKALAAGIAVGGQHDTLCPSFPAFPSDKARLCLPDILG